MNCNALTNKGTQCHFKATNNGYCGKHSKTPQKIEDYCISLTSKGIQCHFKAINNGYCGKHYKKLNNDIQKEPEINDQSNELDIFINFSKNKTLPEIIKYIIKNKITNEIKDYFNNNIFNTNCKTLIKFNKYCKSNLIYFENINKIILIQRSYKRYISKKIYGPCVFNRKLSYNEDELTTMENINNIPLDYFFSFKQNNNYYTFDIRTLNAIISLVDKNNIENPKNKEEYLNPYNRQIIDKKILNNIQLKINILKKTKSIEFEKPKLTEKEQLFHDCYDLFSEINRLGNYTNGQWFMNLDILQLYKLYYYCKDIWDYSYNVPIEEKKKIVPPSGKVFVLPVYQIKTIKNIDLMRKYLLEDIKTLVLSGKTKDEKSIGAWLFLSAFVLVSNEASEALPHLVGQLNFMY